MFVSFALWIMQYCLAWSSLFVHSGKCMCQNFAGAIRERYSSLTNVFVAVSTIICWPSSPAALAWPKTKRLFAFHVHAIVGFNSSISSSVIPFHLPFLAICLPDLCGVLNMSIKGLKRFYADSRCCRFVIYASTPVLPDPDEGSGCLTYEFPTSTYSDQPRKTKTKRVRFLYDSVVTGCRYKFWYLPLTDRGVQWKHRHWTPRYVLRLWQ